MHQAYCVGPALSRFWCLTNPKSHPSGHPLLSSVITIEEHLIAAQPCMFRRRFVLSIIASLIWCYVYISSVFSTPLHTQTAVTFRILSFTSHRSSPNLPSALLLFLFFNLGLLKLSFHYLEQHRIIFPFMIFP